MTDFNRTYFYLVLATHGQELPVVDYKKTKDSEKRKISFSHLTHSLTHPNMALTNPLAVDNLEASEAFLNGPPNPVCLFYLQPNKMFRFILKRDLLTGQNWTLSLEGDPLLGTNLLLMGISKCIIILQLVWYIRSYQLKLRWFSIKVSASLRRTHCETFFLVNWRDLMTCPAWVKST